MWTVWVVLSVLSGTHAWPSDADCLTANGSAGSCRAPEDCRHSYHGGRPVLCRYSRGYGMRICCPRSSIYTYKPANERELMYNDNQPLAFPSESTYNEYRPYTNPFFNEGSNYQPYNSRPSYSIPNYPEKPSYGSESINPSYGFQERPRPSHSFEESHKPSYSTQERPDNFRPRPADWGIPQETTSWEYQNNRKTTPQPSWAVEENSRETSSSFNRRMSEIKCEEYSRPVSQTIDVLPLSIDAEAVPLKVQKCDFSAVKLIVGGEASELGEFPHMAAVGFQSTGSRNILWNCGGTLISERYVMTAGHCINTTYGNPVVVRLGEYNLQRDNDGADPVDYTVDEVILHPNYVKSKKYNDIALIRLSQNVRFNKWIRPACLPSDNVIRGNPTATGWGRTDFVGHQSDTLMKVSLSVINNHQCNSYYSTNNPGSTSFSSGIVDTMICAGVVEGGRDTCLGDSGGPLTITKKDNPCVYYVVGITSFGKICGAPNSPGVYTRVSKYVPWLERTVWS